MADDVNTSTNTDTTPPPATAAEVDDDLLFITLFEPNEECICEFGDIILVADDGFHPPQKLRVSSCILAMSSKPFKALFSKRFAEGQAGADRHSGKPHEILMKDSPIPLKHLCQLLHHQSPLESGEKTLPPHELFDLGLISDKYDAVEAIRFQTDALLARHIGGHLGSLDRLVAAAFLLDQVSHFRRFTATFVMLAPMIHSRAFDDRVLELLPADLLGSMISQQSIARQELSQHVASLVQQYSKACEITDNKHLIFRLVQKLGSLHLMPFDYKTSNLQTLLERFQSVQIPLVSTSDTVRRTAPSAYVMDYRRDADLDWNDGNSNNGDGWGIPDQGIGGWGTPTSPSSVKSRYRRYDPEVPINAPTQSTLADSAKKVEEMCVGICLHCIQEKECRERHRHYWPDTNEAPDDSDGEENDWGRIYARLLIEENYEVMNTAKFPGYWDDAW